MNFADYFINYKYILFFIYLIPNFVHLWLNGQCFYGVLNFAYCVINYKWVNLGNLIIRKQYLQFLYYLIFRFSYIEKC